MDTTYIVSGHMRSGTSMMMRCLVAGGMRAAYDEIRNTQNERRGAPGYTPNPAGYYELCADKIQQVGFPLGYEGRLLKVLWSRVTSLSRGRYLVIYMTRDPHEVAESVRLFFNRPDDPDAKARKAARVAQINAVTLDTLSQRMDMRVIEGSYQQILDCPTRFFQLLKRRGWPINVKRAAAEVDLTMYRTRECLPCREADSD
jgi:hypothetical protein